jgi:predicted DNA-binding transcriptional regulator AlpA
MCPSNTATPSPVNQSVVNQPPTHSEILTVEDLAKWLRVSKRSVYEMTCDRGQQRHEIPLPILRLPVGLRFLRRDIEAWLERCSQAGRAGATQ